jgi:hypothetical protein
MERNLTKRLAITLVPVAVVGSLWTAVALASSAAISISSKAGSKVTLTGVVSSVGKGRSRASCPEQPKVSVLEGAHTVGSLDFTKCGAALNTSVDEGTAMLDVGGLKGRLRLHVEFQSSGPLEHSIPATHGVGYVSNRNGLENLRVKRGEIPTKVGTHFTLVLNTKVEPLPR